MWEKNRKTDQRMHYADYKTILSQKNGINLYRGCSHGCIYCDSRSRCYQMDHDFENIEVKRNAVNILESQLRRRREPCMVGTGAMCDPYMPLEDELQLTRQSLLLLEKYGFGATVLTKSGRILRDLDVLKEINRKTKCVVQMTLTTYDDGLCRIVEPNVSATSERFRVLERLREAGIPTVVWITPILPFINDSEENLRGLLDYCVRARVQGIICFGFGVTMRAGNREYFYQNLDRHFPGLKRRYVQEFGEAYECRSPNHHRLMAIFKEECTRNQITCNIKDVFGYLHSFETTEQQLSFFEGQ